MSRKFNSREKVLLVVLAVLLVVCGYYLLVAEPVSRTITQATARQEDAETLLTVERAKLARLEQMEGELAQLKAQGGAGAAAIADYDNVQRVVQVLNSALSGADSYNLLFSPVTFDGHIASRTIDMVFTCTGYRTAKDIITQLYDAPYRCRISAVALMAEEEGGEISGGLLTAKLTITFYEYTQFVTETGAES